MPGDEAIHTSATGANLWTASAAEAGVAMTGNEVGPTVQRGEVFEDL